MDGGLADPTFQEAVDAERDRDEIILGIQCHGCGYQLWTHVRPHVPTEIRCFRDGCGSVTVITASSPDCTCGIDKDPTGLLPRLDTVCPKHDGMWFSSPSKQRPVESINSKLREKQTREDSNLYASILDRVKHLDL